MVVTDQNLCCRSADIEVGVTGSFNCIEINQVITPNNDNYNDDWKMKNMSCIPMQRYLFTTGGQLVSGQKILQQTGGTDVLRMVRWYHRLVSLYTLS